MWATLHALTLILLPIVTIAAIVRIPQRRCNAQSDKSMEIGIILAYVLASMIVFPCLCDRGGPWLRQTFLPLACMVAASLFIGPPRARRTMVLLGAVTGFALQFHVDSLLDAPEWAYDRKSLMTRAQLNQSWLARVSNDIETRGESDRNCYPADWLGDLQLADGSRVYVSYLFANTRAVRVWHTWITGLLRVEGTALDVWFPGGTLKEAAGKLEVRVRPGQISPQAR